MKSIDLNALSWFCKIVEEGSIQSAAKRLDIPAPTLSRHLKNLETKVGIKLLNRTAHKMELTQEGLRYYNGLSSSIEAIDEALVQLESENLSLTGSINISAPNAMTRRFLNEWLLEFMNLYPGVSLTILPAVSDFQAIEDSIDLALVVYPSTQVDWVQRLIVTNKSCVLASPDYIAREGIPAMPEALNDHALLGSSSEHRWVFIKGEDTTTIFPKYRYVSGDINNILDACLAGIGVVCIPKHFAQEYLKNGQLVELFDEYKQPDQGLYMTYPDRVLLPLRVRRLIDFLTDKFRSTAI